MKLTPHPIFSEYLSLTQVGDDYEWREIARWIKFEENVEQGGNRWSKPYVSTLLLKSVFDLRQLMANAFIQLNLKANNFRSLTALLTQKMIDQGLLNEHMADKFQELLLKPRSHQYEHNNQRIFIINFSSPTAPKEMNSRKSKLMQDNRDNIRFMRKIPADAEAHNILIGQTKFLNEPLTIFIRMENSHIMDNLTEVPLSTRFLTIFLVPEKSICNYHEIGRAVATLMSDDIFRQAAYRAETSTDILNGIDEFLNAAILLPPRIWNPSIRIEPPDTLTGLDCSDDTTNSTIIKEESKEKLTAHNLEENSGLNRSGRVFGGLINDIRRKAPWYWSDFKDGFSIQCVASITFLYFACLSPIITFGGLLSQATGKNMAAMESLVSGFVCGIIYGLFSGQPLTILGSTGPVLVFESIIYEFCQQQNWDYLTFRFWIGTWITVILLLLTALDASALVRYITRFTEENFATLIAFIFIFKALENVAEIGIKYPIRQISNCSCILPEDYKNNFNLNSNSSYNSSSLLQLSTLQQLEHQYCSIENGTEINVDCSRVRETSNIFLMSVLLFLGTFLIASILKSFKNTLFFSNNIRQYISDFSVIIAIVAMSLLDFVMQVNTPKLEVPKDFKPTLPTRNWLVTILHDKNPIWSTMAAVIPALLGTILIFMDQQITAVIVNRKENKLRKGCGYHLDLFILAILIQICSLMGLPWFVAATVLSINHVKSLKLESECSAPGEKPQFLGVREQRLTHILTFSIIGLSVFLVPVLSHIPMPVLFGVFLYMGITSLHGLEFFDRILIMFMPQKYQPDYNFLRKVPIRRVHLFTGIQLLCLVLLWMIKSFSISSIFFPLMLVVMIGIRKVLNYIFSQQELEVLDDLIPEYKQNETNNTKAVQKNQSEVRQHNKRHLHNILRNHKPQTLITNQSNQNNHNPVGPAEVKLLNN